MSLGRQPQADRRLDFWETLMVRKLIASALLLAVAAAAAAQNKVHLEARVTKKYEDYFAKKTDGFVEGTVEAETPAGIKIKTKGKDGKSVLIAPSDVLYVEYAVGKNAAGFRLPLGRIDNAVKKLTGRQKSAALEKAVGELKAVLPEVKAYPAPASTSSSRSPRRPPCWPRRTSRTSASATTPSSC